MKIFVKCKKLIKNMRVLHKVLCIILLLLAAIGFNEFLIYNFVLRQCNWPNKVNSPVKAMLLSDTHLLGPIWGHWFDRLLREWQMYKAFQTAVELHRPDVIFITGDIFDEGDYVNNEQFEKYAQRFNQLFSTTNDTKVYSIIGNHDVAFHYRLNSTFLDRFKKAFIKSGNSMITIRDVHFVQLNSMTMSRDGCVFCTAAERELQAIANELNCAKNKENCTQGRNGNQNDSISYSRPILLQHFPTYRNSDQTCTERDNKGIEIYREDWEVLSKNATDYVGGLLNPRVSFSGHSHHYCRINNSLGIEEYTIASFNYRNKRNPSFLLAEFSPDDYSVTKCDMPLQSVVMYVYIAVLIISVIIIKMKTRNTKRKRKFSEDFV